MMWDRLITITDEIYESFRRTSFSPMVREVYDAVCVLFDGDGNLLAQATMGPASFIGTIPLTLAHLLERYPAKTLGEGDVLATNDPWMGTGHQYDISMVRPVFLGGNLVAYTGTVNHLPDIGGTLWSASASECYEEGLRLPPCKIVEAGEMDSELIELIRSNVRAPDQVVGDIKSAITTNFVGSRLLLDFMREQGLKGLRQLSRQIIGRTERVTRSMVRKLKEGVYTYEKSTEGFEEPVRIRCTLKVKGDEIDVDYQGTSPTVGRGVNVPLTYTRSYTLYALKCVLSPGMPNNQGSLAPFTVSAPAGCILNAPPPCAVAARHITGWFVPLAVWGALARVVPEKVIAEPGMVATQQFRGTDLFGRQFSLPVFSAGGTGARPVADGVNATSIPTSVSAVPIEVAESETCLLFERKEIVRDSGGPGKYRGGCGQQVIVRNISLEPVHVAFIASDTEHLPSGLAGGQPGMSSRITVGGKEVDPKSAYSIPHDEVIILRTAGGGGFFDPKDRAPELVRDDVLNGYVSPERAEAVYGLKTAGAG